VRDAARLERALYWYAAALKQVPACESNPFEAIPTNLVGGRKAPHCFALGAGPESAFSLKSQAFKAMVDASSGLLRGENLRSIRPGQGCTRVICRSPWANGASRDIERDTALNWRLISGSCK
jgi:hypothetical protein